MSQCVDSTCRDILLVRRVLSRLTLDRCEKHGSLYFDVFASSSKLEVVNNAGRVVAFVQMAQLDAIVKEESERARSLPSKG